MEFNVNAEGLLAIAQGTLEHAREIIGLSRKELAARLGMTPGELSNFYQGEHDLTMREFAMILEACGCTADFRIRPLRQTVSVVMEPSVRWAVFKRFTYDADVDSSWKRVSDASHAVKADAEDEAEEMRPRFSGRVLTVRAVKGA